MAASADGHREIAASVAHPLGVPADSPELVAASGAAVLRRYAVEAAWLARYGLSVSARAEPLVHEADGHRAFADRSGDTRATPT